MPSNWTRQSFKRYTQKGYLDFLRKNVYTIEENPPRKLDSTVKKEFTKLMKGKDDEKLFRFLISSEINKRPINDSYFASFLKAGNTGKSKGRLDQTIKNNPQTISGICARVRALGVSKAIKAMEVPIMSSRQMGSKFRLWLNKQYPCESNESKFFNSKKRITIFDAPSDEQINSFVKKYLCEKIPRKTGVGNEKGIDLLIKVYNKGKSTFVIGECKFLTDNGGAQNNQFNDAIEFVKSSHFKMKKGSSKFTVKRCAIIDGVCWMEWKDNKMQKEIQKLKTSQHALSLLLLNDFLRSL